MKILIIMPYFLRPNSTLPDHFQLFLNSCGMNKCFEWLFITNSNEYFVYPSNVKVLKMSFEKYRELVQHKFNFPISLENGYKLCDYKPLLGYIFSDLLNGYDFWGYCDSTDTLMGDLNKFITEDILINYDKIYWKGHLTLYKNEEYINNCILNYSKNGKNYKYIIQNKNNFAMDETGEINVSDMFKEKKYSVYLHDEDIADISPLYNCFYLSNKRNDHVIFQYNKGKIIGWYLEENELCFKEYAYVHFQKRNISLELNDIFSDIFYLIPNRIVENFDLSPTNLIQQTKHHLIYPKFFF